MRNGIPGLFGFIACVLLGSNLTLLIVRSGEPRSALGQAASAPDGTAILATVQGSGNEPLFVIYDVASKHASAYAILKSGIELRGVRELTWDLQIQEVPKQTSDKSVAAIREQVEKAKK